MEMSMAKQWMSVNRAAVHDDARSNEALSSLRKETQEIVHARGFAFVFPDNSVVVRDVQASVMFTEEYFKKDEVRSSGIVETMRRFFMR